MTKSKLSHNSSKMLKFLTIVLAVTAQIWAKPNDSRIIGGSPAQEGQFPFIASLQNAAFLSHVCGAGIIDERHLITAAHCVFGASPSQMVVFVGSIYLNGEGTYYLVSKLTHHPDFDPFKKSIDDIDLINDIGIVTLKNQILLGGNVQIINLPIGITVPSGSSATAIGWGSFKYPNEQLPNQLQQLTRFILDNQECSNILMQDVFDGQLCFGGDAGHGLCHGDSGSPLVYQANNKSYVIGVVSTGNPCAVGDPDVYTRVSYYLPWIQEQLNN